MNRPDKIQIFYAYNDNSNWVDWNRGYGLRDIQSPVYRNESIIFNLNTTLQALSQLYHIFIPTTESYENYGGAEEVAQNLTDVGFQLTFFLMGPNVNESKLTSYTKNFVYWSDMSNSEPDNWDEVRSQAYGCDSDYTTESWL
ncbi:hypothetical protein FO519_009858 [Halicephalobus sp. NKZ332]|nr:hypothetical protein FO519_009858 [Halicephalobus sp. NKZ332]